MASAPIRTSGTVVSVTAGTLVVKVSVTGRQLLLRLDATTIYERNATPVAWSDLRPGQDVKLKYRVEPDGSLKAQKVKIQIQQAPVVRFQLVGVDVGVASAALLVRVRSLREGGAAVGAGRTVSVRLAPGALILLNKRSVRLTALRRGDRLNVSGVLAGGALTAERVVARRGR